MQESLPHRGEEVKSIIEIKSQHYSLITKISGNLGAPSGGGGCGSAWLETDWQSGHGRSLAAELLETTAMSL